MANSPVAQPTVPNKQLYNDGSEWQNDYSNQPDYYQIFYRNYDAALGRFIGVDPQAVVSNGLTPYQYAGNNPIMFNDPLGNLENGDINGGTLGKLLFMVVTTVTTAADFTFYLVEVAAAEVVAVVEAEQLLL